MACEQWREKLDLYIDGELDPAQASALSAHFRGCADCAAEVLGRVQLKRSVQTAGKRYTASAELRNRIAKSVAAKPHRAAGWYWKILAVPALAVLVFSIAVNMYVGRENARQQRVYSELADLHVAALASTTPVDILSTDRHTVKPWFQGKIPFSFNLPELQGSNFSLVGGRVAYFEQTPGAQLIYQVRKHEISVFVFQDRGQASLPEGPANHSSFTFDTWTKNGLRYFVIGDANADDIRALSKLLRDAG